MNTVLTVLEIVAPVFLLGAIGYAWVKMGFEYRIQFVTRLAMTLGVPALIFVALMRTEIEPAALSALSIATLVAYGAVIVPITVMVKAMRLETRTFLAPLIFGNTGNIGLPLALFAFGTEGLDYAVVVFAIMAILSFTFGVWLVSGGGSVLKVFQEPIVAATILGAVFLWQGWETPRFVTNTLEMIGQTAIPLMLITLGVAVARLSRTSMARAFMLSLAKAVICIAIAWVAGRYFELAPVPFAILVLQVATPVAVTSYMLAEKYGADADAVAGLVVASTLISVALLPVLLGSLI